MNRVFAGFKWYNIFCFKRMIIIIILTYTICVSECFRDSKWSNRIINGYRVKEGEFPSMVAIYERINKRIQCGATLLKPNYVITAAHCVLGKSKYYVLAGVIDLQRVGFKREVKKIIIHPDFDYYRVLNDIALLELVSPLPLVEGRIECVRLPKYLEEIPYEYGTALGFGLTEHGQLSQHLMGVKLRSQGCTVADHYFCLGHPDGNKDTCEGDSGGPFLINNTLYGITSHGMTASCGKGLPGIYIRVPYYVRWIRESAKMRRRPKEERSWTAVNGN